MSSLPGPEITRNWLPAPYIAHFLGMARSVPPWHTRRSGHYFGYTVLAADMASLAPFVWPDGGDASSHGIEASRAHRLTLIRVDEGSEVRPHVDDAHWMLSQRIVMLQPAVEGGILTVEGVECPMLAGDCCLFDANRQLHHVTRVERGGRFTLSVAVCR